LERKKEMQGIICFTGERRAAMETTIIILLREFVEQRKIVEKEELCNYPLRPERERKRRGKATQLTMR
jgi:hypothetical protein